jgi:hypothetical protein
MPTLRLLVCGGRDFNDAGLLSRALDAFSGADVELCHGGVLGADSMAGEHAKRRGWSVRVFHADWRKHGKAAGPIRNRQMLAEFKPDIVVAFPGGRGTADMVRISRKAGVTVSEFSALTPWRV